MGVAGVRYMLDNAESCLRYLAETQPVPRLEGMALADHTRTIVIEPLYGASIVDSVGELGSNGAVELARRMAAEDARYVMADQYANEANPRVHEETTGPEVLEAVQRVLALAHETKIA